MVLILHGGGGGGGNMEWLTRQGFNRIADRDGAIIVYPDGVAHRWNDGRSDPHGNPPDQKVDDLGFLRALPREISSSFPVDPRRIYVAGISNGGLMSYRLACDAADVFAAVAAVAANLSEELAPRCAPSRPVSVAIFNGTTDPIMPWSGGPIKVLWSARGTVLSTQDTTQRWVSLDRCATALQQHDPIAGADDGTTVVPWSTPCAGKTEINLYEIRAGGHTWPGGEPYLGEWLVGKVSHQIDANQTIWQFFQRHSL